MNLFDVLVVLGLFAAFVLGMIQGAIRRVLGIASIVFSFLLAANLREPFGSYLAANWTQFPRAYTFMLAFATLFVTFTAVSTLIIQGFYKRTHIYARAPIVDDAVGGVLGVIEAVILLGVLIVILDSFSFVSTAPFQGEIGIIRNLFNAVDGSQTQAIFRGTLIPAFYILAGPFVPAAVKATP